MARLPSDRSQGGFTAIEILVVVAILSILLTAGIPLFTDLLQQNKVIGQLNSTSAMFRLARSEAIKSNVRTVVRYDFDQRRVEVFADLNGSLIDDPPDGVFNPVGGEPPGTTDYWLGSFGLPAAVEVEAPPALDPIDGFTTVSNAGVNEQVAIFVSDGSIDRVGAIRLADARGNFFEVRVAPQATARVQLLKWNDNDAEWWEKGQDGHEWEWS